MQMQVEFLFEFSTAHGAYCGVIFAGLHQFYSAEKAEANVAVWTAPISSLNTLTTSITKPI
jgi:hypothetical protein